VSKAGAKSTGKEKEKALLNESIRYMGKKGEHFTETKPTPEQILS
jgi:hypothetical protein